MRNKSIHSVNSASFSANTWNDLDLERIKNENDLLVVGRVTGGAELFEFEAARVATGLVSRLAPVIGSEVNSTMFSKEESGKLREWVFENVVDDVMVAELPLPSSFDDISCKVGATSIIFNSFKGIE